MCSIYLFQRNSHFVVVGDSETFVVSGTAPTPEDPLALRTIGALGITFGVAYWCAYQDSLRNVSIMRVGGWVIVVLGLTREVTSWFVWVSTVLIALMSSAKSQVWSWFGRQELLIPSTSNPTIKPTFWQITCTPKFCKLLPANK